MSFLLHCDILEHKENPRGFAKVRFVNLFHSKNDRNNRERMCCVVKSLDTYRGCMIGGAVGDALGYAVEFLDLDSIVKKYGKNGITDYALTNTVAQISDDTQMTMFTANGLLLAATRGEACLDCISLCYKAWLRTQTEAFPLDGEGPSTWLTNIPALFAQRAPGNTCLTAIRQGANGTMEHPINNSKGCGGIMRVAPIGLYFAEEPHSHEAINLIGAQVAALTHGHELGYIPAAALVHVIHLLAHYAPISVLDAVLDMQAVIRQQFSDAEHLPELMDLLDKAIALAASDVEDCEAIKMLGEGWVAEETLAIAIYCALKYSDDFERCIVAAVNHSGDSDSTGAVAGQILGAALGYGAIPKKYLTNLELKEVILELGDDLYHGCGMRAEHDAAWEQKYIDQTYRPTAQTSTNIIQFPDYQALKEEVERLRTELSMLLLERDELVFVQCKNLDMQYMLTFGALEYKAYEAECTALRLKRKLDLIRAKKNRQEAVILLEIEAILEVEFAEYQQKLEEQIDRMNAALKRSKGAILSEQDEKELKKLYRSIVKRLHPDLNPDITPGEEQLFHHAVEAYEIGDLKTLQVISVMIGDRDLTDDKHDPLSALVAEKERLTKLLSALKKAIQAIQSEYPYAVKDLLASEEKTAERKKELEACIAQYGEMIAAYEAAINEIMGG